jgi:hypothetical protein
MTPRHVPPTLPSIIKQRMRTDAQLAFDNLVFRALAGCPITYGQSIACMFYASLADSACIAPQGYVPRRHLGPPSSMLVNFCECLGTWRLVEKWCLVERW